MPRRTAAPSLPVAKKNMATTSFTKKSLGFDVEAAVTPPPPSTETAFLKKPKLGGKSKKKDIPEGLWTKCPD